MKAEKIHVESGVGRVLVGPKKVRNGFARIVSQKDGSGRIERLDAASGTWVAAHESITFSEIWNAPSAPAAPWTHVGPGR